MNPRPLSPVTALAATVAAISIQALGQTPAAAPAQREVTLALKTLTAQMKFDQAELRVPPGAPVKLLFDNADDMPHNVVFCTPGTKVEDVVAKMLENPDKAMKNGFLPDDPRVWLKSKLLNPHEKQTLEFNAPTQPGVYPFVCSFPGHAQTMQGTLRVYSEGPRLKDLKFSLYHGSWSNLPEFEKLTAHRSGEVPDNTVQLNFDDYKNHYGLVFTGNLEAPDEGEYTFQIASDDGARLLIDGQKVVTHDGIHPPDVKEGTKKLKKGQHTFRLEYFQAEGGAELYVGWSGPGFDTVALSKWQPSNAKKTKAQQKKDDLSGILLGVQDEPVVYRNFIANAGNRGIGVGFPGGVNIAWSAESMNLAMMWKGAFIDAARHWKGRGGGYQPPAGFDVFQTSGMLMPFAVLDPSTANPAWPGFQNDTPQETYAWKGYSLDVHGIPSFEYAWNGVDIEDKILPKGDYKTDAKLIRTVKLQGKIQPHSHFLLAKGTDIKLSSGAFLVKNSPTDAGYLVQCDGAKIEKVGDKSLLIVPARAEIRATYSWANASAHGAHAAP
jgi:azurin